MAVVVLAIVVLAAILALISFSICSLGVLERGSSTGVEISCVVLVRNVNASAAADI